jgi:hypothetical protein
MVVGDLDVEYVAAAEGKQTRQRSVILIECCAARSPFKSSRRLDGAI